MNRMEAECKKNIDSICSDFEEKEQQLKAECQRDQDRLKKEFEEDDELALKIRHTLEMSLRRLRFMFFVLSGISARSNHL